MESSKQIYSSGRGALHDLGPLYHDYSLFGVEHKQLPGMYTLNQRCKAPTINAYIQLAIAKSRIQPSDKVSFAELFCADGYYAMAARYFGADESVGIDNDREGHFEKAPQIADALGLTNVSFLKEDVQNLERLPRADIVANLGGLYHVPNPRQILEKSFAMARKFLIVQTVYSLASDSPEYFETPAPGWNWGCRFSLSWLDQQISELGWSIVDRFTNELEGNERAEDRGSAYYLIRR